MAHGDDELSIGLDAQQLERYRTELLSLIPDAIETFRRALAGDKTPPKALDAALKVLKMTGIVEVRPREGVPGKVLESLALVERAGLLRKESEESG